MKRFLVVVVLALAVATARPALAQQPAATTAPQASTAKPWDRLALFIPAALIIGAGTLVVRRRFRERGWTAE